MIVNKTKYEDKIKVAGGSRNSIENIIQKLQHEENDKSLKEIINYRTKKREDKQQRSKKRRRE